MVPEHQNYLPEQKWKLGIVGAGYMSEEYLKVLKVHPSFEVCGINSLSRTSAMSLAERYGIITTTTSIESLYLDCRPDAVIVAVPELATREVLEEVMRFPWTCLVEKPAGINLAQAQEIANRVRVLNHPTFVALNRRFYSSTASVTSALNSLPGPRIIDVFDQEDPQMALESGTPREVVDEWMYANSIHIIDLARSLARGRVEAVETRRFGLGLDASVILSEISYSSGDRSRYFGAWNVPGPWGIHVTTSQKRLSLQPLEDAYVQEKFSRQSAAFSKGKEDLEFKPGLWGMMCQLDTQLAEGHSSLPTIEDSLESMRLISRIFEEGSIA